jgi:hypothetical protein
MMKKILGYIAVLVVFSWVTSANALPVASIDGAAGNLTIGGYADSDPNTMDFIWDFTGGTFQVNEMVSKGATFNFDFNGVIHDFFGVDKLFSANFDMVADRTLPASGRIPFDTVLRGLYGLTVTGSPNLGSLDLNAFTTPIPTVLTLLKVVVGGTVSNPLLILSTEETTGALAAGFNRLESHVMGDDPNSMSRNFSAVSVPEPTVLLFLCSGLLVMFGFSKQRA